MGMALRNRAHRYAESHYTHLLIRFNLLRAVRARKKARQTLGKATSMKLSAGPALGYCTQTASDLIQAIRRAEDHLGRPHRRFR